MAIVESAMGRSGSNRQIKREFYAFGYATEALAIAAVHADAVNCPTYINSLPRDSNNTQAEEIVGPDGGSTSDWRVIVNWSLRGGQPSSGLNYSFTISGGSFHRNYAISQTSYGADAPDVGEAINFDGKDVKGVTVPAQPSLEFSIETKKAASAVTNAYLSTVSDLVYKTNNATFEGWAADEVLFMGLTGSRTGDDEFTLNFKFGRNENRTGQTVAGIGGVAFNGWDYVWVRWKKKPDPGVGVNAMGADAMGVYVAKVHNSGAFSGLGL